MPTRPAKPAKGKRTAAAAVASATASQRVAPDSASPSQRASGSASASRQVAPGSASPSQPAAPGKRGLRVVPGGRGSVSLAADAPEMFPPDATVERLVAVLGNNGLARLLGVSASQPARWRSGKESISPANRRRLSDLDHVLDRLLLELWPDQAGEWLTSPNAHLSGAVPVDVLVLRGAPAVLEAIDALATGAFA